MSLPSRWLAPARRRAVVVVALCAAMLGMVPLAQAEVVGEAGPTAQVTEQPSEAVTGPGATPEPPTESPSVEASQVESPTATDPQTESPSTDQPRVTSRTTTQSVAPQATVEYLPRAGWTATASSQQTQGEDETQGEDGRAANAIDGESATYWHSRYSPDVAPRPHWLTLDLGAEQRVAGLRYLSRPTGANGNIKGYQIHTSLDGTRWALAAEGELGQGPTATLVTFGATTARYVRLTALTTHNGLDQFAAAAEVDLVAAGPPADFDAVPGGDPIYTEQQLATNGQGGFPSYRIPALTVTNEGHLLAAYDGRPTSAPAPAPNSVLQRRSTDNGKTWGAPTTVRAGTLPSQGPQVGYSDPSYVVDRHTGDIFNFHVLSMDRGFTDSLPGVEPTNRNVLHANVSRSRDNGVTWAHETITADITADAGWQSRFASSGQGIQLRYGQHAGRLLQQYTIINGAGTHQAVSVYSDDHGATWKVGEPVGVAMDENKTVELSDGRRVMLNSGDASGSGYRKVAISTDGGHSFSEVTIDRELPASTARTSNNASIIRAFPSAPQGSPEAKVLLYSDAATRTQSNASIWMSFDDGGTWPVSRVFRSGNSGHSTLVTQPDGTIGLFYEVSNGLRYANFNLAWLMFADVQAGDVTTYAGGHASATVTVTNTTNVAVSGTLALGLPEGWTSGPVTVGPLDPGATTTVNVPFTSATGTGAGEFPATATLTTPQGTVSDTFTVTVRDALTVTAELANPSPNSEYAPGDPLKFTYRVTNVTNEALFVVQDGNLAHFSGTGTSSCAKQSLAVGATRTCTGWHVVTQEDLDAGRFGPRTTWTLHRGAYEGVALSTLVHAGPDVALAPVSDLIPQDQITATASSANEAHEYQVASHAVDGDPMTMWHNHWNLTERPHHITLDLADVYEVHTLRYLPRQTGNSNGILRDYDLYVSADGETWGDPVVTDPDTGSDTRDLVLIELETPKVGQYVKLVFNNSWGDVGRDSASAAEFNVQGKPVGIQIIKQAWDLNDASAPTVANEVPRDAPLATGDEVTHGTAVAWTYEVTNLGDTDLADITVTDTHPTARGTTETVTVYCPRDTLTAGESMTCVWSSILGVDLFARYGVQP